VRITLVDGDLFDQDVGVLVNAWNRNFIPFFMLVPHGVAGGLRKRAGMAPFFELGFMPLAVGEARVTTAGRLPCKAIVHVLGIEWYWRATEITVREGARAALEAASARGFASIALPLIGSGVGGFSEERSERLMREGFRKAVGSSDIEVRLVRFRRGKFKGVR